MRTFWSTETAATCSKTCSKVSSSSDGGTVMTVVTSGAVLLEGNSRGHRPRGTRHCVMLRESPLATTRQSITRQQSREIGRAENVSTAGGITRRVHLLRGHQRCTHGTHAQLLGAPEVFQPIEAWRQHVHDAALAESDEQ